MMHHGLNAKITLGLASLAGGVTMGSVYIPKRVVEKGILVAGMIVSAVSIFSGLIFTDLILETLGLDPEEHKLVVAFILGMFSLSIINMLGNWLRRHEDSTITEAIEEVREELKK
jgi:hypothetical protein